MQTGNAYGLIDKGCLAVDNNQITWIGDSSDLPAHLAERETIDLEGRLVTPALIDCHTHIVFGGNRAREFEMRLEGGQL